MHERFNRKGEIMMNAITALLAIACVVAYWPEPEISNADRKAWAALADSEVDYLTEITNAEISKR